jgi:DNA-binding MurR/RpiR family transcriptional regulator
MTLGRRTAAASTARASGSDVPSTLDTLKKRISTRFDDLPPRLQLAARHLIDHPNAAAVETIRTLSSDAGIQPSVLVRLAQALGYDGFSDMQAVFRSALLAQTQSYGERMRAQREDRSPLLPSDPGSLLKLLCDGSVDSLRGLREAHDAGALQQAIELLAGARTIQVIGLRRSWPIGTYLVYLLSRSQCYAHQLGAMGGMLADEMRTVSNRDVLVAISFHPFHADTVAAVEAARTRGIAVIAITDSALSPIARDVAVVLEVRDAEVAGFRSVAASMVLCQGLAVGVAMTTPLRSNSRRKRNRPRAEGGGTGGATTER